MATAEVSPLHLTMQHLSRQISSLESDKQSAVDISLTAEYDAQRLRVALSAMEKRATKAEEKVEELEGKLEEMEGRFVVSEREMERVMVERVRKEMLGVFERILAKGEGDGSEAVGRAEAEAEVGGQRGAGVVHAAQPKHQAAGISSIEGGVGGGGGGGGDKNKAKKKKSPSTMATPPIRPARTSGAIAKENRYREAQSQGQSQSQARKHPQTFGKHTGLLDALRGSVTIDARKNEWNRIKNEPQYDW